MGPDPTLQGGRKDRSVLKLLGAKQEDPTWGQGLRFPSTKWRINEQMFPEGRNPKVPWP